MPTEILKMDLQDLLWRAIPSCGRNRLAGEEFGRRGGTKRPWRCFNWTGFEKVKYFYFLILFRIISDNLCHGSPKVFIPWLKFKEFLENIHDKSLYNLCINELILCFNMFSHQVTTNTVDRRNPKQPPGMYPKPWNLTGFQLPFPQLVNAEFLNHQQYFSSPRNVRWSGWMPRHLWSRRISLGKTRQRRKRGVWVVWLQLLEEKISPSWSDSTKQTKQTSKHKRAPHWCDRTVYIAFFQLFLVCRWFRIYIHIFLGNGAGNATKKIPPELIECFFFRYRNPRFVSFASAAKSVDL